MIILVLLNVLTSACTFNNVTINKEEDKRDGKLFSNKSYSNVNQKNYNNLDGMVGDSLKLLAGSDGVSKLTKFINSKVGNYKNIT